MTPSTTTSSALAALLAAAALTGCTSNSPAAQRGGADAAPGTVTVEATDDACAVSAPEGPSGTLTFTVTNAGDQVTEFYLLGEDGLRIIGEVENIAPGLSRDLVLAAPPGDYFAACKPGMVGEGIRTAFTVTDTGTDLSPSQDDAALVEQADAQYASYVRDQTEQLLTQTQSFATLYTAGQDDEARALYPEARLHWERIETVAESFGDLDPRMDAREADLAPGEAFTGWHRIEKDLWPQRAEGYTPLTVAERTTLVDALVTDTQTLYDRTRDMTFTADQIGNGTKGLLDEVAEGKVTGEEEYWSRTDLWDFQGNIDGARVGFEGLRPLLESKDAELATQIDARFTDLQALLDQHREGEGFVLYTALTPEQVKALSDSVNALSEPLSRLTATVLS